MGIIVRNLSSSGFSNVRLSRGESLRKIMESYGTGIFNGKEYNYLIPIQGNTDSVIMDGVDSSHTGRWYSNYNLGSMFNRQHNSASDGFLSNTTGVGNYIQLQFNYNFYMDAFYIKGLRSDTWKPERNNVRIMFKGEVEWAVIALPNNGSISTNGYLIELPEEYRYKAIDAVQIYSFGDGYISYSRFDLLQET